MPRSRGTQDHPKNDPVKALGWYGSSNESVEGVADWDLKAETLVEAITGVLAKGWAIQFGTSYDGGAILITVYEEAGKRRKSVTDAIEFDDAIGMVWNQVRQPKVTKFRPGAENAAD